MLENAFAASLGFPVFFNILPFTTLYSHLLWHGARAHTRISTDTHYISQCIRGDGVLHQELDHGVYC